MFPLARLQFALRPGLLTAPRCSLNTRHCLFSEKVREENTNDEPIKFTTSPGFRMGPGFLDPRNKKDEQPWYQTPVIMISISSLLIYFCILREENDIDQKLGSDSLYQTVRGLERAQLEVAIKYFNEQGMDASALVSRLKEVLEEEGSAAEETIPATT